MLNKLKKRLTYAQWIALGFFMIILLGAILLCLPISSKVGTWTPFIDALFTATSATCVTGLVIYDTFLHFTLFGQIVILTLIQIGGLGVMTVITLVAIAFKRQVGLYGRRLLVQAAGTFGLSGLIQLIKKIAVGTFIFEGIGAAVLAVRFSFDMGFSSAIYCGIFHSISAFCNAGFDVMGRFAPFSSLTKYASDPTVNITIMLLIVIGGIGFIVWNDILKNKMNFKAYEVHSKVVLITTISLVLSGAVLFFITEYGAGLRNLTMQGKIFGSFFLSVTPRTAGFATVPTASLSESGSLLSMILMLIGGSPGSTAGGIKTTTFVVLVFAVIAAARGTSSVSVFKRKIDNDTVRQATVIFVIYLALICISAIAICGMQPYFSLKDVLFEVVSAVNTVGSSAGITASLNIISKLIITFLMYCGRIGVITFALILMEKKEKPPIERPVGRILVG